MTNPDSRTSGQNLVTDPTGRYQFAIWVTLASGLKVGRIERGVQTWGVDHDEHTFASGPEVAAFGLPVEPDDHNYPAIAVDGRGFLHAFANMHLDVLRYMVGNTAYGITAWTAASLPGVRTFCTYPTPVMLPDGSIWMYLRDNGASGGADGSFWRRTPTGTSWSARTAFVQGCLVPNAKGPGIPGDSNASDTLFNWGPYLTFPFIEPADSLHPGRMHVALAWRPDGPAGIDIKPSYFYSDDGGQTWKNITGANVVLPIDPINTTNVQTGLTDPTYVAPNGIIADKLTSLPHFYMEGVSRRRIERSGNAWVQATEVNPKNGRAYVTNFMPYDVRGTRWLFGTSASEDGIHRRPRIVNAAGTVDVALGGYVNGTAHWLTQPDPVAWRLFGTIELLTPDGDIPKVVKWGNNARNRVRAYIPPDDPNVINVTGIAPSFPGAPFDVTQAISDFLAAVPDGASPLVPTTVRFPLDGSYNIEGSVNVPGKQNVVIDGNGSTFFSLTVGTGTAQQIKNRAHWILTDCKHIQVTGVKIDGPFDGTNGILHTNGTVIDTDDVDTSYDPNYESQQGIRLVGCTDIQIDHNSVTHVGGDLIELRTTIATQVDCGRIHIHRNFLRGCGRQGIAIDAGYEVTIEHNGGPVYPAGYLGFCGHAIIDLEPEGGGALTDITIESNKIGPSKLHFIASGQESFTFIGPIFVIDNVADTGADMDIVATAIGDVRVMATSNLNGWYVNGRSDTTGINNAGDSTSTMFTIGPGPATWGNANPASGSGGVWPSAAPGQPGNNGFGSYLKAKANGAFPVVDGVQLIQLNGPGPSLGVTTPASGAGPNNYEFILLNGQTNPNENGVYMLVDAGSPSTRWRLARPDFASLGNQLALGDHAQDFWVSIREGSHAGENWEFVNPYTTGTTGTWLLGVDDVAFTLAGTSGRSAKLGVNGRRGPWTVTGNDCTLGAAFGATFGNYKFNNIDGVTVTGNIVRLAAARRQRLVMTQACCDVTISGNTVVMTPPLASGGVGGDGVTPVEQLSQGARPDYDYDEHFNDQLNYTCP